tara:strand:+ start:289 stop:480 length:192 start_codon:yes stop_codon:yes gene_type:complete
MKQYKFEFDKFVRDLERRNQSRVENLEELMKQEEAWDIRELVKRYREHPHNQIRYDQDKGNVK